MKATQEDGKIIIKPGNSKFYLSLCSARWEKDLHGNPDFFLSLPIDSARELRDELNEVLK